MDHVENNQSDNNNKIAYTANLLLSNLTVNTLLESITEGVIIINERGQILLINSKFEKMSGYTSDEVIGNHLNIFLNPGKHGAHILHLKQFFSNPRIRPMGDGLELSMYKKDKSILPVEISLSYIDTETARLGIAFITDNTERKKAITALTQRNIELDAFAHTIAHDLKSSINGISGFSKILLDKKDQLDSATQKKYLEIISQSSDKMDVVISELLLFASIDKIDHDFSYFNMKAVVESACSRLNYQINQSGAVINIDRNLIDCESYAPWVEEVWLNYLSNAIKYGGELPQITVTSERENNGFIKYSVIDKGPGIIPEIKNRLFEKAELHSFKSSKGSGLGLSIVERIMDKLDGKVSVESEINKGSKFSFYLKEG